MFLEVTIMLKTRTFGLANSNCVTGLHKQHLRHKLIALIQETTRWNTCRGETPACRAYFICCSLNNPFNEVRYF